MIRAASWLSASTSTFGSTMSHGAGGSDCRRNPSYVRQTLGKSLPTPSFGLRAFSPNPASPLNRISLGLWPAQCTWDRQSNGEMTARISCKLGQTHPAEAWAATLRDAARIVCDTPRVGNTRLANTLETSLLCRLKGCVSTKLWFGSTNIGLHQVGQISAGFDQSKNKVAQRWVLSVQS